MADETPRSDEGEILEISAEDLGPEPPGECTLPAVEAGPADEVLVIDLADLDEMPRKPIGGPPVQYPQVSPLVSGPGHGKKAGSSRLVSPTVVQMALAGLIGGFVAWAIQEPGVGDEAVGGASLGAVLLAMAGFGAVLGGVIGLALGSVEGLTARVAEKAVLGGGLGRSSAAWVGRWGAQWARRFTVFWVVAAARAWVGCSGR